MDRIALGFIFVLAACASNSGDDTGPNPDGNTTMGSDSGNNGDVQPRAGAWSYTDAPVSSTCPNNVPTEEAGSFVIDQVTASGFRVVPGDGTDPFPCTLGGGGNFDCPDRVKTVEDLRPSLDAVITVHASASGSFSSATAGTGEQHADATCAGTQCNAAGNVFPCAASVTFTIQAQ